MPKTFVREEGGGIEEVKNQDTARREGKADEGEGGRRF